MSNEQIFNEKDNILQNEADCSTELNRNVVHFCATVFCFFQDVLNEREKVICRMLINGQTLLGVSRVMGISRELVRQIFWKSIRKINNAFKETVEEMEFHKKENETLKHRIYILENEMLSSKSLQKLENLVGKEQSLCRNALRLMNTPIPNLPLPVRVIHVLRNRNITTFGELPLLSINDIQGGRNSGKKTIFEIQRYLEKFSLRLGMSYDEVIKQLATLSDEDIPSEYLPSASSCISEDDISAFIMPDNSHVEITLDDVYSEIGSTRKSRKKWSRIVKNILEENNIDTLEKLLALTPSGFKRLNGVGPTTLQHTRKALSKLGIAWSDVPQRDTSSEDI